MDNIEKKLKGNNMDHIKDNITDNIKDKAMTKSRTKSITISMTTRRQTSRITSTFRVALKNKTYERDYRRTLSVTETGRLPTLCMARIILLFSVTDDISCSLCVQIVYLTNLSKKFGHFGIY